MTWDITTMRKEMTRACGALVTILPVMLILLLLVLSQPTRGAAIFHYEICPRGSVQQTENVQRMANLSDRKHNDHITLLQSQGDSTQTFQTLEAALKDFELKSVNTKDNQIKVILNCTCPLGSEAGILEAGGIVFAHPMKQRTHFSLHDCELSGAQSWSTREIVREPSPVTPVRDDSIGLLSLSSEHKKYGKPREPQNTHPLEDETINARTHHPSKSRIGFSFIRVSFTGSPAVHDGLFGSYPSGADFMFENCKITNYSGEGFLRIAHSSTPTSLGIVHTTFSNIKGYAIHAKGLDAYDISDNDFSECSTGHGGIPCVYLHMCYTSTRTRTNTTAIFRGNTFSGKKDTLFGPGIGSVAVRFSHINPAIACDNISLSDNEIPIGLYDTSVWLEDTPVLYDLCRTTAPEDDTSTAMTSKYPMIFRESEGRNSMRVFSYHNPKVSGGLEYHYGLGRTETCRSGSCRYKHELLPYYDMDSWYRRYCTVAASGSTIADYYSLGKALSECPHTVVLLLGGIYAEPERQPISMTRDGIFLMSFKESIVLGTGHTLKASNITIRGITFKAGGTDHASGKVLLTLAEGPFRGVSIKNNVFLLSGDIESVLRISGNTSALTFSYNTITAPDNLQNVPQHSFYDSIIATNDCVENLVFDGNVIHAMHIGPRGAVSLMCLTGISSFRDNVLEMHSYEGVSPAVHLQTLSESSVVFSSNMHSSLGSYSDSQVVFKLEGLDPKNVWGNTVSHANKGLHYVGDGHVGELRKNNPFLTVYSSSTPRADDDLSPGIANSFLQELEAIDPPLECIVDRENAREHKTLGYEYFETIDDAITHCSFTPLTEAIRIELRDPGASEMHHTGKGISNLILDGMGSGVIFSTQTFELGPEAVSLTFKNLEIHSKSLKANVPIFRCSPKGCDNLKWLSFENVHFFGGESPTTLLHLSGVPASANIIIDSCSFTGWETEKAGNCDAVYVKQSPISADNTGKISITSNSFNSVDGYSIRIENLSSAANVSANAFTDCGGRYRGNSAMASVSENEGASLWFSDNKATQTRSILYPTSGTVSHPHWFSTYWVDIRGQPKSWNFNRNSCSGHPVGVRFPGSLEVANTVFPMAFEENTRQLEILDVVSDFVQRSGNCGITGYHHDLLLSDPRQDGSAEGSTRSCSSGMSVGTMFGELDFSSPARVANNSSYAPQGSSCKCYISPPSRCVVDKSSSKQNVFYGKWIFNTLSEAFSGCLSHSREIEIRKSPIPYQERIVFNGVSGDSGWMLYSENGAEVLGSGHVFLSDDTTVRGIKFFHYGEDPTVMSPYSHPRVSGITFLECEFCGDYTRIQAVKGEWNNLSLGSVRFTNTGTKNNLTLPEDVITIDQETGSTSGHVVSVLDGERFTMENCTFYGVPNGAITLHDSKSYAFSDNHFCVHEGSMSRNYTGIHLVVTSIGNTSEFHRNTFCHCETLANETETSTGATQPTAIALDGGMTTAFWLESLLASGDDDDDQKNIPTLFSNNRASGTHVGMRITRTGFDHWNDRNSVSYHRTLADCIVSGNNTGIQGLWHDVVMTPPDYDSELQRVPFQNLENICDGGCVTADFIGIGALVLFSISFCCLLCCCICIGGNSGAPYRIQVVWSNYLGRLIPRDKKWWPTILYGYLPGQTWNHQARPVPAFFADRDAAATALANEVNYPGYQQQRSEGAMPIGAEFNSDGFVFVTPHPLAFDEHQ